MGILLVIGMMSYAAGLCWLFQRVDQRSSRVPGPEDGAHGEPVGVMIPDHVPGEWVEAYRSEPGG
jgi:hypothetical protein